MKNASVSRGDNGDSNSNRGEIV